MKNLKEVMQNNKFVIGTATLKYKITNYMLVFELAFSIEFPSVLWNSLGCLPSHRKLAGFFLAHRITQESLNPRFSHKFEHTLLSCTLFKKTCLHREIYSWPISAPANIINSFSVIKKIVM